MFIARRGGFLCACGAFEGYTRAAMGNRMGSFIKEDFSYGLGWTGLDGGFTCSI